MNERATATEGAAPPGHTRPSVAATFRSPAEATFSRPWLRKRNRLPAESYKGNAVSLTMVTEGRVGWFTDEETATDAERSLIESASRSALELLAYVIMPNHLHVMVQIGDEGGLSTFLKDFKQRTGFRFKQRTGRQLWQKGAFDHALRGEENLEVAALYIAHNPVRRGMSDEWTEYAYWGGSLLRGLAGDLKVAATSAEEGA